MTLCLPFGRGANIMLGDGRSSVRDYGMAEKDMNERIVDSATRLLSSNQTPMEDIAATERIH